MQHLNAEWAMHHLGDLRIADEGSSKVRFGMSSSKGDFATRRCIHKGSIRYSPQSY